MRPFSPRGARARRGVTLVEVLIVVAIMALISAGVGFLVVDQFRKAQIKTTVTRARALRGAVLGYLALESPECPTVDALATTGKVESEGSVDAWERPFAIACEVLSVTVISSGPDRVDDTEDDIRVPVAERHAATSSLE